VAETRRRRAPARAQGLPAEARRRGSLSLKPWLPSGRSLAVGFGLLSLAAGGYAIARETSVFAVERIDVEGAPPALAAQIRTALAPVVGESLVSFSRSDADRQLSALPQIASVRYDRDFPHTLHVRVSVEQATAVLRRGSDAWLVAASGRVLAALQPGTYPPLPRIWLAAGAQVTVGLPVPTGDALEVAAALQKAHLPARVLSVRDDGGGQLVLQLAGGREVRLGDLGNLAVKLAVAAAILPHAEGALYVDVSVPTRAVAGYAPTPSDSQVSGQG